MIDHTIVHFEIPAEDVEKLRKFYSELFGWKIEKVQGMDFWLIETVPVDKQGRHIHQGVNGAMYKKEKPDSKPLNYVSVESADQYIEKIKVLGGKIVVPKQEVLGTGWEAVALDPEGNPLAMFQPIGVRG